MRIVIEVEGERVTTMGPEAAPAGPAGATAIYGDPVPGPAPAELLERAKKLGALSAGAAQFGRGAALVTASPAVIEPKPSRGARKRRSTKKRQASARKGARR